MRASDTEQMLLEALGDDFALLEKWSDAARAASIAARRAKASGGDWRKAGRQAALDTIRQSYDPKTPRAKQYRVVAAKLGNSVRGPDTGHDPSGVPWIVRSAQRAAQMKSGVEGPARTWARTPNQDTWHKTYDARMNAGVRRRAARFKRM